MGEIYAQELQSSRQGFPAREKVLLVERIALESEQSANKMISSSQETMSLA